MPSADRTGQTVGKLTVIADRGGAQLHCRCECGREASYPRTIFKPSYRGPKACPWCLGSPCEECGATIPRKPGPQRATCSESCAEARKNRRERERYYQIRDTEHFQTTRQADLERLAEAMDADPELAESIREDRRRAVRAWRDRQLADPILRARYLEVHREQEARRLASIRSDPEAYAEHLRRYREWYHSLSDEDYRRIFVEGRGRGGR